ncbi:phage/plasmid primase, P4 family [Streptomyces sp. NPDC047009]|uniref:DNA primase family protein n=1 Tax=Streptomyces sp. NPDC047009 TaxID=3154496 RepID=UPI0033F7793E
MTENWETLPDKLHYNRDNPVQHVNYSKFVARHTGHHLRYMENVGWYRWNGAVWEATGGTGAAFQAITDAAHVLHRYATENPAAMTWVNSAVKLMLNNQHRRAIVAEMEHLRALRVSVDDFDSARHLLTFRNGTVDLRTGELTGFSADNMLTQQARVNYSPEATAPRWLRWLDEVFPDDVDLQRYYQTWLGLCITGEVRDHVLGVWYGAHGRNGKGTTIRTMQTLFGEEIVKEIPYETFERTRNGGVHTEVVASLRNTRMVVAQEGTQGVPMDVARLKNWSGGDRISTRHLHGKSFSFDPKFTLVLATNELPEFSAGGAALWARTRAILFGQSFAGREDRTLEPTIQGPEAEGVAAWIVEGAKRYYAEGLVDPISVEMAREYHKAEVDPLKPLIGELFVYDEDSVVKTSEFNRELKFWRDVNGMLQEAKFKPLSVKRDLKRAGVDVITRKGADHFKGVRLLTAEGAPLGEQEGSGPGIFKR